jgi:hypothetical protein
MAFVGPEPHVDPGTLDEILLLLGVIDHAARLLDLAEIAVTVEDAERFSVPGLGRGRLGLRGRGGEIGRAHV